MNWTINTQACGGIDIEDTENSYVVARTSSEDYKDNPAVELHKARLISAAPELLTSAKLADKLIRLIEEWADAYQADAELLMDEIVALAQDERGPRDAVAKAEGRE